MKEAEMKLIGEMIASIIREPESEEVKAKVKRDVAEVTAKFPMYGKRYKFDQTEAISAS
jgi:glycine hydroxymethyltransferase